MIETTGRQHAKHDVRSGGDCSYPGFVQLAPGRALVSYYSSHEGKGALGGPPAAIYLADLSLDSNG